MQKIGLSPIFIFGIFSILARIFVDFLKKIDEPLNKNKNFELKKLSINNFENQ